MAFSLVNNNVPKTGSAVTSLAVTITAPTNGNALVACIATSGTSTGRVTSISQTGATWNKVVEVANSNVNGNTSEIWVALNVSGAGTTVTINLAASLIAIGWVGEYSGLASSSATDKTATNTGNSSTVDSGTTASTTQASELVVASLAIHDLASGLNAAPSNGFTSENQTSQTSLSWEVCDKIVSSTGTQNTSDGDVSSGQWSGVIATFVGPVVVASSIALFPVSD